MQVTIDEKKEKRKRFYESYVSYLSKDIIIRINTSLEYDERREIEEIEEKYREKRSKVESEARVIAWRKVRNLKTKEQWEEAMKKWDEDRKREKEVRDESIKMHIEIEKEMNEMIKSGMNRSEIVEKIRKKYSRGIDIIV